MSVRCKDKHVTQLLRRAESQGCSVSMTRNSHIRIVTPAGITVFTGGSPSDWRAVRNLIAQLRRAGIEVKT